MQEQSLGDGDIVKLLHHEPHADETVAVLEHYGADSATFAAIGGCDGIIGSLGAGIKCVGYARNEAHRKWPALFTAGMIRDDTKKQLTQ